MGRSTKPRDVFNPSDSESLAWDTRKRLIELTKAFEGLQINKTRWTNLSHILSKQRKEFSALRREIATLQQMMFNMTERFSPKFDNIPLRAKLYLSRTTTSEREEVSIKDLKTIRKIINA